jgi:hypothetical protein
MTDEIVIAAFAVLCFFAGYGIEAFLGNVLERFRDR